MQQDALTPDPLCRKLRIFAFDPSVANDPEFSEISEITIPIRWENDLHEGPVGEYIEVVDADPASRVFYRPVNLDDKRILAQNGVPPSETNPQFHQQMVYAVAMATINHFEQALGRVALWSPRREEHESPTRPLKKFFVRRLRIYPHALRDKNAYYSPEKKALLFGYFPVGARAGNSAPGTLVFTCLSHDIIAHETTHALLDGVHPRFNEAVNHDVLAFHEAFADIVALFQHFSYPGVLRNQIALTRGDLTGESLLSQLAQQFGLASGRGHALRYALGSRDKKSGVWKRSEPNIHALEKAKQPHARGAILVAAVFGAFLTVYRNRTRDLYRIASEGTGILREGEIHPDLAARLGDEAARVALYVLQMCIRAIDYCPPVGLTFGDYLRGIVTADYDLNPEDPHGYRLAFVESFVSWGIWPIGVRSSSVEALLWPTFEVAQSDAQVGGDPQQSLKSLFKDEQKSLEGEEIESPDELPEELRNRFEPWNLETNRYETWKGAERNALIMWRWLVADDRKQLRKIIGIELDVAKVPMTVFASRRSKRNKQVAVEVHSVRTALRRTARGGTATDLVVEITQRRHGYFDIKAQEAMDKSCVVCSDLASVQSQRDECDFIYRSGCTLLIDPGTMTVRRVIKTPGTIDDDVQLGRLRHFLQHGSAPADTFAPAQRSLGVEEPFAMLHRHDEG